MENLKMKLLDEVFEHLQGMQGSELKDLLDQIKQEEMMKSGGGDHGASSVPSNGEPHGIALEKIELMPKSGSDVERSEEGEEKKDDDDELTDDELQELVGKYLK